MQETILVIWENIYVGIVCSILTALIVKLRDWINNYRINRKYNLTGLYVTKYEDIIDGEKTVICTPAKLTQMGWNIVGETSFGDVIWRIEGKVLDSGYVYGMYAAEGILNQGVGDFFLRMDVGRMEGMWSGYDNMNKIISSGKYTFVKVDICKMRKNDIGKVLQITDKELGKDYISREKLEHYLDDKRSLCYVVKFEKKIIGYCLCSVLLFDEIVQEHRITNAPSWTNTKDKVGLIKTIAIQKEWQRFGIGELLLKHACENFRKGRITVITSIAWRYNNTTNAGRLLEKIGMKSVGVLENYWKEESEKYNYSCPVCGNPPCTCAAEIYFGLLE